MVQDYDSIRIENSFWNFILIIVLFIVIWYFFIKNKERFATNKQNNDKIIQKINNISRAMNDQYTDYATVPDNQLSQYSMNSMNQSNGTIGDKVQSDKLYPNLNSTKSFTSKDLTIENTTNSNNNANKTADGSTKLMNQFGFIDGEKVACNMLGVNSENMDEYKKKFYSMYAHQIECPAKCGMKANGMSKGCGIGSKCGMNNDCSNINTNTSIPDTFALNYLALDNANKKPCVTCNFKPTSNTLNREWMEREYPSYDGLPEDVKIADEARLKKMNLIDANV